MRTFAEYEKQIKDIQKKASDLNEKIIRLQSQRETHAKYLKEEFGIEPEGIDEKIKEFEEKLQETTKEFEEVIDKMNKYVAKLEGILNA